MNLELTYLKYKMNETARKKMKRFTITKARLLSTANEFPLQYAHQ